MNWLLALLGIVMLVVLHELGHFTVAKLVGMRVERFSLFFPPTLLRIKRGETEYAIGAIPAGGYVKITGMHPDEIADMPPEVAARAYYAQAPWKRIAVILAGPGVNIAITFVLFWAILYSGNLDGANWLGNLNPSVTTLVASTAVGAVEKSEPASGVLRAGDRIVSVDGRPATVQGTIDGVSAHRCAGKATNGCTATTPVALVVRRGGRLVDLSIYPRYDAQLGRMIVGFDFGASVKSFGVIGAATTTLDEMWHVTTGTLTGLEHAISSSKARKQVTSIVGITQDAHESVAAGAGYALVFLGFLSLILAVINLFPFLPLDGGHVVWALAEKIRGRRISIITMYRYSSVGLVLLAFLVINGISNDISRLAG